MRSAAAIRWPCHNSTAPAIPLAVDARTTAGGGTRSGARASTTGCASGRKTCSHSTSLPRRALRERASALDKLRPLHRLSRLDALACVVDLPPCVPEEEAARARVRVDVRDDSLALRGLPLLHGVEAGVHLADRLVAEVEEIRIEERDAVECPVGAGHVPADGAAVPRRLVLRIRAEEPAEKPGRAATRLPP